MQRPTSAIANAGLLLKSEDIATKSHLVWRTKKVIKLKYKLDDGHSSRYSTQYIISTGNRTWAINVNHTKEDDFENLFDEIKSY